DIDRGLGPQVSAPGIVPFPRLKRLIMDVECPFRDDVLFRGNSATLEDFGFYLDRHT
ncbi:hypothetical protein LPJ71_003323, partial [Coemansia sp. S17]